MTEPSAPTAKQIPTMRSRHGDETVDEYAWLRDHEDPDTTAYLEAENAYCAVRTARLEPLQEEIFAEIKERTQETDLSVPAREGDWWYYTRTEEGKQYPVHCRRPAGEDRALDESAPEQVLLDGNVEAGDADYFRIGVFEISADASLLAYGVDRNGSEQYVVRFRRLTGDPATLPDEISGVYYGGAFSADGSTFFYTTLDAAMRPYRAFRHRLGTDQADDDLLREETDEKYFLYVHPTRSKEFIQMTASSSLTSEVAVLSAATPDGEFAPIEPRRQGVEYSIDHHRDVFYVLHNTAAPNFTLAVTPVSAPGRDQWRTVIEHRADTRLTGVDAFAGHLAMSLRTGGRTGVRIHPLSGDELGAGTDITFPDEIYTVHVDDNPDFDTTALRLDYSSFITPRTIFDYDVSTRTLELKKQTEVLGGVDLSAYETVREWATATDGTKVPLSVAYRKDTALDGTAPCLLYGYGSYEASMDPTFSIPRLSLLDRGVVYVTAHVRGGGEMGRAWYEDGKLLAKRNTFTDFVAAADHLAAAGYTSYDRVVARGGSAGGLLMGAVANLAPEKFAGILAHVPFVDALNTILDPSLPLTVIEWEEWGNPVDSVEVFGYMRSYAPYENVEAKGYPAIFATAGLNDPRVGYHEPAKWVARLRARKTDSRELLLKTEMGAGHGGKSGRYDAWQDEALYLAWALDTAGATGV
ncbi:MAG: S9 family peptidase [Mycobacteriales bacterium]